MLRGRFDARSGTLGMLDPQNNHNLVGCPRAAP
jgi:hypothetical protein